MKQLYKIVVIVILVSGFYKARAAPGDSCSHPLVAQLCGQPPFSGSSLTRENQITTWNVGGRNYYTDGPINYYQINLPTSSYQPVSIQASFTGYFPSCNFCTNQAYLLWFEKSPCTSDPLAITPLELSGQPSLPDSISYTYNVTAVQQQYYVVLVFDNSGEYDFNLQFGFTNNQVPPTPTCQVNADPLKGHLQLDKSDCYTAANPYQLDLSLLNDNLSYMNILIPPTLNQQLDYLPINDDNKNGFVLTIKTTDASGQEVYQAFDQFPYTYSANTSNTYNVAITLFLKNAGASGIKGFRLRIPGSVYNSDFPMVQGYYNNGNWTQTIDPNNQTYTWLFSSSDGRGDNISSNYSCQPYTFDMGFHSIGDSIQAWYLSDNYGNDSLSCSSGPSNPPRTDCGLGGLSSGHYVDENNWIPIGADGGGAGITGQQCGTTNYYLWGYINNECSQYVSLPDPQYNYYDNGCQDEEIPTADYQQPDFVFADGDQFNITGTVCSDGSHSFPITLYGNGSYDGSSYSPSLLVYQDASGGPLYAVDSSGNIDYGLDLTDFFSTAGIDASLLPPYPTGVNSFTVPLHVPGQYYIEYPSASVYYGIVFASGSCGGGGYTIVVDQPSVTIGPASGATICNGNSVPISYTIYGSYSPYTYQWVPGSSYNSANQTLSPTTSTTYTLYVTDSLGCKDTLSYAVQVNNCSKPTASFTMADSLCTGSCTTPTNTSSAGATTWNWTFTGGNPSSYNAKTPPQVCYANAGSYTVQLIVGNSNGKDTATATVKVKDCSKPTAAFSISNICAGSCTTPTNASSANTASCNWSFPGGNPSGFSGKTPPSVCYNVAGKYPVQLIASNSNGNDTLNQFITVDTAYEAGEIQTPRDTICYGLPAPFTLSGSLGSVQWQSSDSSSNFTNITGARATNYKIQAAYNDIYLKVIAGSGLCADASPMFKLVVQPPLTSKFNWTSSGLTAYFNSDSSIGNINRYGWDFGDNTTSDSANPSHTFVPRDSAYYVCLTLLDGANCSYTYCHYIKFIIDNVSNIPSQNKVNAYPNPFSDYFFVQLQGSNDKIQGVELFDVLGRTLISNLNNSEINSLRMDVPDLADGIYYLRVKTSGGTYIQKLFKVNK